MQISPRAVEKVFLDAVPAYISDRHSAPLKVDGTYVHFLFGIEGFSEFLPEQCQSVQIILEPFLLLTLNYGSNTKTSK